MPLSFSKDQAVIVAGEFHENPHRDLKKVLWESTASIRFDPPLDKELYDFMLAHWAGKIQKPMKEKPK